MTAKKTIKKKCEECGDIVEEDIEELKDSDKLGSKGDINSTYTCDACKYKNWDEGFSSQAEYSDQAFEEQQNRMYEKNIEINKKTNKAKPTTKELKLITNHYDGPVKCSKCNFFRVRDAEVGDELLKRLKKPCPKCGFVGFLKKNDGSKNFYVGWKKS